MLYVVTSHLVQLRILQRGTIYGVQYTQTGCNIRRSIAFIVCRHVTSRQHTYIVYVYCLVTSCTVELYKTIHVYCVYCVRILPCHILHSSWHSCVYSTPLYTLYDIRIVSLKCVDSTECWRQNLVSKSLSLSLSLSTSMLSPSLPKGRVPVMQWKIRMPMAHTSDCGPTYMYVYTDILYHYIYVCVYTNTLYHCTCMCVQQYIIPYTNAFLCVCICIQIYICTNIYPMYTNIYMYKHISSATMRRCSTHSIGQENTFYRTREHIL